MILINQVLALVFLVQTIMAMPLPIILTRWYTAPATTTTQTYTTGTTTVWLPPVQIFISNGVTYTNTLTTGQWATTQAVSTSIYQDPTTTTNDPPSPTTTTTNDPPAPPTTTSTTSTTPTTTSTTPTTTSTTPTTTSTTSTTPTTTSTTPTTTSTTATQTPTTTSIATTTSSSSSSQGAITNPLEEKQPATSSTPTTTSTTSTLTYSSIPSAVATLSPPKYIVYSPYENSGACKDIPTMTNDLQLIQSRGFNYVRIYGSDCSSIPNILPIAASLGIKLNQGFWFEQYEVDSIDSGVSDLLTYTSANGWDVIDFITIGNEAINDGYLTVDQLVAKIASVKAQLQAAGYTGQVSTAEPPNSFIDNPSLCDAVDFVGVNAHSYFDEYVTPQQAGEFVTGQVQLVQNVCTNKTIFVSETGYPSQGDTNGLNVPSPENQAIAIESILTNYGTDITLLTTFDDFWKEPGPYGIEQYFGAIQLFS